MTERQSALQPFEPTPEQEEQVNAWVERRSVPRWIEWTRENEKRGKALDQWGGEAA